MQICSKWCHSLPLWGKPSGEQDSEQFSGCLQGVMLSLRPPQLNMRYVHGRCLMQMASLPRIFRSKVSLGHHSSTPPVSRLYTVPSSLLCTAGPEPFQDGKTDASASGYSAWQHCGPLSLAWTMLQQKAAQERTVGCAVCITAEPLLFLGLLIPDLVDHNCGLVLQHTQEKLSQHSRCSQTATSLKASTHL